MSFEQRVEAHHRVQYLDNFMLSTRYNGSKLAPYFTERSVSGEGSVAADLIGKSKMERAQARDRNNPDNPPDRTRRWLSNRGIVKTGQYLDQENKWNMIGDPQSELIAGQAVAAAEFKDRICLGINNEGEVEQGGLLGPVIEGKTGGGATVAFPAGNILAHSNTGLTVAKMRATRKKMGLDENDLASIRPVWAISTEEMDDLLAIIEAGGAGGLNVLEHPLMVDGRVKRFMGFDLLECNILPKSGQVRTTVAWIKTKVVLGVWQEVTPKLWNDSHAWNTPYAGISMNMDATRIEDLGVQQVLSFH
jgi:hypothetical protein